MRWTQIKLYSIAAPLALLPLMDFSFEQIGPYLKGTEFRSFVAQMISAVISNTIDAFLVAAIGVVA